MKFNFIILVLSFFSTISQAQNVGVGTTAPAARLTVNGSANNPSIPNNTSTGAFRIGVSGNEGIDIGKVGTPPYAAWFQAGFGGVIADPICLQPSGGNVGIGTISPDPSARLEVNDSVRGFLPPRMDSTHRNSIVSPTAGLIIYNTSIKAFQCFNGTAWYSTVHYIGESYGGGIVFYVYDNGQHGLIAATADQSTGVRWYGGTSTNTRARADGVAAGLKNTSIIIAGQGPVDGAPFAATLCNEYSVTVGGVTFGDWYLPSKYELNLLYLQKVVVGGFANNYYWSSSEAGNDVAWSQNFAYFSQASDAKSTPHSVRVVRAF